MQPPLIHETVHADNRMERILIPSGNQSLSWPHLFSERFANSQDMEKI